MGVRILTPYPRRDRAWYSPRTITALGSRPVKGEAEGGGQECRHLVARHTLGRAVEAVAASGHHAAPHQLLDAGNPTVFVALRDREAVDRAWIDVSGMRRLRAPDPTPVCVFVFTPTPEGAYSRMFAAEYGIVEDPATGSSTGPLAAYMMRHGLVSGEDGTRFVSEQGTRMGRRSLLHVHIRGRNGATAIDIGGHVTPLVTASMLLPSSAVQGLQGQHVGNQV